MNLAAFLTLGAACALSSAAIAQEAPPAPDQPAATHATARAPADKPAPIYDEKADGRQQIAQALKHAKKENQRVLIQWGYNACSWCRLLHNRFAADKSLARELLYEYSVVYVDALKNPANTDLPAQYGADVAKQGFPYLTILDADGKVLANQETASLELKQPNGESVIGEGAGHDPAKVLAFLKSHEAAPLVAETVLADARAAARNQNKKIFLHFGAPWCVWCKRLDAWLETPAVAAALAGDLVELKIDQDRMTGAHDVFERYKKNSAKTGIPWYAIIDPVTGDAIATSDAAAGNIGFPAQDDEITHFIAMIEKARKNMTDADIAAIRASLEAGRKK